MAMTPEQLVEAINEINAKSAVLVETVNVLNLTGAYMSAEPNSPIEDQTEAALNDRIHHLVVDHPEMVGHILIAMSVLLVEVPEWENVQAWLTEAEADLQKRADEIGYNPH